VTVSMYPISVPVFIKHLNGLAACLKKAQAYYAEKKYDEATLIHYRFYPDMFSFARQVQAMCDHAKNCTALLSGVEAPKYEDTEKSLAELVARIENPVQEGVHAHRTGNRMALENILERLRLFFDAEAQLRSRVENGRYRVEIAMPYKTGGVRPA